ncbi:hypothetical protein [Microbacterium sp.]|uniref:hypothetical protein n=1 Tax=Microbacterium sp. TaxID=51671 RepID=UPI003A8EBF06
MSTDDPVTGWAKRNAGSALRVRNWAGWSRVGGRIGIFPINYVIDDGSIVFRTRRGRQASIELTVNDGAIRGRRPHGADPGASSSAAAPTSVDTLDEREAADGLGLAPWIPTLKYNYVRITDRCLRPRVPPAPRRAGTVPRGVGY